MTSGGDCPGLNAAIRACAKTAIWSGYEVIGIHNGWEGLLEHDDEVLNVMRLPALSIEVAQSGNFAGQPFTDREWCAAGKGPHSCA